jgi:hypothetical protein
MDIVYSNICHALQRTDVKFLHANATHYFGGVEAKLLSFVTARRDVI